LFHLPAEQAWLVHSVFPEILEPIWIHLGVSHCVRDIFVAHVVLQRSSVVPIVGELKSGGVPEHVGWIGNGSFASIPRPWLPKYMDENVLAATLRLNELVTLCGVEPLHDTTRPRAISYSDGKRYRRDTANPR
jgi:hypothetical protein